ncbi:hypothetical protein BS332_13475 [Shewanella algae]|nr:hypothetical protein BS332_13475 [Shewanella algae]
MQTLQDNMAIDTIVTQAMTTLSSINIHKYKPYFYIFLTIFIFPSPLKTALENIFLTMTSSLTTVNIRSMLGVTSQ